MTALGALSSNWNAGIDANWDTTQGDTPSNVTAVAGGVQIAHPATGGFNDIRSVAEYDLTGSAGYVEVNDYGDQSLVSHECHLIVTDDTFSNYMEFIATGNTLFAYGTVAGATTQVGDSIALDLAAHKWLRIRESGGTTFWDTAPDGVTWTNRWSLASPFAVTAVIPIIRCGIWQDEASGSQMKIDNFNTLGAVVVNTGQFFAMF